MAKRTALVNLVKTKLSLVLSHRDDVQGKLNSCIDKVSAQATSAVEDVEVDLNTMREMNAKLETVLELLLELGAQIDEGSPGPPDGNYDTPSTSSLSLSETSSATSQKTFGGSGDADITKLENRIEVLETAFTTCRREINQSIVQQSDTKEEMDARLRRLEDKMKNLVSENTEAEIRQSLRFDSVEKKVEELETLNKEQDKRVLSVVDQLLEMKKRESDTVKEQEVRLSAIEDLVSQTQATLSMKAEELDSRKTQEMEQTLKELNANSAYKEKNLVTRMNDLDEQLKVVNRNSGKAMKQTSLTSFNKFIGYETQTAVVVHGLYIENI